MVGVREVGGGGGGGGGALVTFNPSRPMKLFNWNDLKKGNSINLWI